MCPPLDGRRILVPPSRLGLNPLIHMLERQGAEVVVFPELEAEATDPAPLDRALQTLGSYAWLVVAGEGSARHLLARLAAAGRDLADLPPDVCAIGHGAVTAFRQAGREATLKPRDHFAEGVAGALGPVTGARILLVREAGASPALPEALRARGATVTAVAGHAVRARGSREALEAAFGSPVDAIAFANPATVRLFSDALVDLGLTAERCLGGVLVVAVGPATAEVASARGLPPDVVAGGRLKRLQESLIAWLGRAPGQRADGSVAR